MHESQPFQKIFTLKSVQVISPIFSFPAKMLSSLSRNDNIFARNENIRKICKRTITRMDFRRCSILFQFTKGKGRYIRDTYLWRIDLNVFNYSNQFAKTTNLDGSVEMQGSISGFNWLKQTKNNNRIQKSLNRTFCQLQNNNYRVTRLLQQNQCLDLFLWTKRPKIICSAYKEAHQIALDLQKL